MGQGRWKRFEGPALRTSTQKEANVKIAGHGDGCVFFCGTPPNCPFLASSSAPIPTGLIRCNRQTTGRKDRIDSGTGEAGGGGGILTSLRQGMGQINLRVSLLGW